MEMRAVSVIYGTDTADTLTGTGENDTIYGYAGADQIEGGDGDDLLLGGAGGDSIEGGAGDDILNGGYDQNLLLGGDGNDKISGSGTLGGGLGDDILEGIGFFSGGAGNDMLVINPFGSNVIDNYDENGSGADTVSLAAYSLSDFSFTHNGNDLVMGLTVHSSEGTTTFTDWYLGNQYQVEQFQFFDVNASAAEIENLTGEVKPAIDGDTADLTAADTLYADGDSRTGYGRTDYAGDDDHGALSLSASAYYDVTSTGDTAAYVYDATTDEWLYGDSYQNNLFLDSTHSYAVYVQGFTAGERYSVTVAAHSIIDADPADLTASDTIHANAGDYRTGYGHTDYVGDDDYGTLSLTLSGYYDVTSTGDTAAYVYDATAGAWLYGFSYQSNLYLDSSHTNYVYVQGFTAGENYSVTVSPRFIADGDESDLTAEDILNVDDEASRTGYGHTDYAGDDDQGALSLSISGHYNVTSTGDTAAYVYDATTGEWLYGDSYHSNLFLDSTHANYVYVQGFTAGEKYSVTVEPEETSAHAMTIQFDYRYDGTETITAEWRTALEAAAALWSDYLLDDFGASSPDSRVALDFSYISGGEYNATLAMLPMIWSFLLRQERWRRKMPIPWRWADR